VSEPSNPTRATKRGNIDNGRKGGHFAAWEQPQLFSEEVRAALSASFGLNRFEPKPRREARRNSLTRSTGRQEIRASAEFRRCGTDHLFSSIDCYPWREPFSRIGPHDQPPGAVK